MKHGERKIAGAMFLASGERIEGVKGEGRERGREGFNLRPYIQRSISPAELFLSGIN